VEGKLPVVLVKWYDYTNWLLDRIDAFPMNQRFIIGQRAADRHGWDLSYSSLL
jgi:hypothetical protein